MFREKLNEFMNGMDFIPSQFSLRDFYLDANGNKICVNKSKRIKIKENHKWHEYTMKTFLLKQRLSPCMEKEVMGNIDEWLLFKKLKYNKLRAKDIMHCRNVEVRRSLLERFGYEKFLIELKGRTIHSDGSSRLVLLDWYEHEEPIKLVRVKDASTERYYVLRVPPDAKTCKEAIAWTFGMNKEEYNLNKET